MESTTVEFQRFGRQTGVLRRDDRYLRTIGAGGALIEVENPVSQGRLDRLMGRLDYQRFSQEDGEQVLEHAELAIESLTRIAHTFIPPEKLNAEAEGPYQADIVIHAYELAQLPLEVLEEVDENVIVTRRIRQPWSQHKIERSTRPRVLFAWAEPSFFDVPHDRHLEKLNKVLEDWGGADGKALVELPNVTIQDLSDALSGDHGFTHVHLLAHGVEPDETDDFDDLTEDEDDVEEAQNVALALDDGNGQLDENDKREAGDIDHCTPTDLAAIFADAYLPASFTVAACSSGEISPFREGATLAHTLHRAGVPVVVAPQLALTKNGSDILISTFLKEVVAGTDPRLALRECRDGLRLQSDETYYDRIALVGYIHLDDDIDERDTTRSLEIELERLESYSKVDADGLDSYAALVKRYESVRGRLSKLEKGKRKGPLKKLTPKQLEEVRGLQASSVKREASVAWELAHSNKLSESDKQKVKIRSRDALRRARKAYERAAATSRDHHWVWVQWLALEAIISGTLQKREIDWIIAQTAADDVVSGADLYVDMDPDFESEGNDAGHEHDGHDSEADEADDLPSLDPVWARGSLVELDLLSPLLPDDCKYRPADPIASAKQHLDRIVELCRERAAMATEDEDKGDSVYPIIATARQLDLYSSWWGQDDDLPLPKSVVADAELLAAHLHASAADLIGD